MAISAVIKCGFIAVSDVQCKMSAVEDILNYKKNPDEDLYALLKCDEHSTVSKSYFIFGACKAAEAFQSNQSFMAREVWTLRNL